MRLLLDTHILLWALADARRLGHRGRELIDASEAYVSAASIWEVSIKAALGKLQASPRILTDALAPAGYRTLSVTPEHAAQVHLLEPLHRDPFDRMLIAQARAEGMSLLTDDEALSIYGPCIQLLPR
jgi:PIN domain nuclease of toxin-antitoxin system